MFKDKTLTYISLFSSAGVGCYGFKKAGFECIATNELIERRLNVQRYNQKCRYESGYICDDISRAKTKKRIFAEMKRWEKLGNDKVDVVVATPPCQGMSVANHKKADNEIVRNSLVVESVHLIRELMPRFFLLENVSAFMKTGCTAPDGTVKAIGDVIEEELSAQYIIMSRVLNFKNYGSNSSRTRTLVIGVSREMSEYISPTELYPIFCGEATLRSVIGGMPRLKWGQICKSDFYHAFRTYPKEMRRWVHGLKEGECAFDNKDVRKRPHTVIDGKIVPNKRKNGDKYTRQYWDKVGPCIHTRNDQLASQNTIHPSEDRVFSIRELMKLMTIPDDFRWVGYSCQELNAMSGAEKKKLLKKEEIKIRQSIGEAVPTQIFYQIACNIRNFMDQEHYTSAAVNMAIDKYKLGSKNNLRAFIEQNPLNLGIATLSRIAELTNSKRENNAAYYTNKFIVNEIFKTLPDFEADEIYVLEPSVGVGNFLPFLFRKYESVRRVHIDVVDIDRDNLALLKILLDRQGIPPNVDIHFVNADFLLLQSDRHYDLVVGNPPFTKLRAKDAKKYLAHNKNQDTTNTFEFFLEKAMRVAEYVAMITPKALLNTPQFRATRELLSNRRIDCILDFGEKGFKGVLVETICICINVSEKPKNTKVVSLTRHERIQQKQAYITDGAYPYWIIYRNTFFDRVSSYMEFDRFTVFRDRQITNHNTKQYRETGCLRVLKSRNISDDGKQILDIPGYDSYIDKDIVKNLSAYKFVGDKKVYLTPNMTYNPRVMRNQESMVVNGSVAVLIPKEDIELTDRQLAYFATEEYRDFYRIARNYQTRSLNVDASSVYFYGIRKEG